MPPPDQRNRHCFKFFISPIIKNYVRKPKLIAGNLELFNASKICRVPFEQIIVPLVIKPHIRSQNLVLFILQAINLSVHSKYLEDSYIIGKLIYIINSLKVREQRNEKRLRCFLPCFFLFYCSNLPYQISV